MFVVALAHLKRVLFVWWGRVGCYGWWGRVGCYGWLLWVVGSCRLLWVVVMGGGVV